MWLRLCASLLAGVLVAACSGYGELRAIVREGTPDGAQRVGACQEFGVYGVIDDPAYGCAYFVPGTRNGVAAALARHLERDGFDARCQEAPFEGVVELNATRGAITVTADVSRRGSIITMSNDQPLNISDDLPSVPLLEYRSAPAGYVILKLEAGRYEGRGVFPWKRCLDVVRGLR